MIVLKFKPNPVTFRQINNTVDKCNICLYLWPELNILYKFINKGFTF